MIEDLQDGIRNLKIIIQKGEEKINDLEQYQRRDSVRFLGVGTDSERESSEDCEQKVLTIINKELNLGRVTSNDISIAHRVGLRNANRPRPIIVKFLSRKTKNEVIQNRRLLKGTHKGIVEDLIPLNMKRLLDTKAHSNVKNCWTKEGTIYAQLYNSKIVKIVHGNLSVLGRSSTNTNIPDIEMHPAHAQKESKKSTSQPMASTPKHPPRQQSSPHHRSWEPLNAPPDNTDRHEDREHSRGHHRQPPSAGSARCQSPSPSRSLRQLTGQKAGDDMQCEERNQQHPPSAEERSINPTA